MASTWFKHETSLVVMIEILKLMRDELDKATFSVNGQRVKAHLQLCSQKRPLARGQAMFFSGLKESGRY